MRRKPHRNQPQSQVQGQPLAAVSRDGQLTPSSLGESVARPSSGCPCLGERPSFSGIFIAPLFSLLDAGRFSTRCTTRPSTYDACPPH